MLEKIKLLLMSTGLAIPLGILIVGFGAIAIFGDKPVSQDIIVTENDVSQTISAPTGVPKVYVAEVDVVEDLETEENEESTGVPETPEVSEGEVLNSDEVATDEVLPEDVLEPSDEAVEDTVCDGDEEIVEVADLSQVVFEFEDAAYVFDDIPLYASLSLAENLCLILYEDPYADIIEFLAWLEIERVVEMFGDMDGVDEFIEALSLRVPNPENTEAFLEFIGDYFIPMG